MTAKPDTSDNPFNAYAENGLQVDALFQVFCFGSSKSCYERHSIVAILN